MFCLVLFKFSALVVVLSLILFVNPADSDKYSICERKQPTHPYSIVQFKCPPDNIWFSTNLFTPSNSDKKYCCGSVENRYCCKKSQFKKELYIRQRSDYNMSSSISSSLFAIAFFLIVFCICCRCISLCFRKKRLNQGLVISSAQSGVGNIDGQNVHVIGQAGAHQQHPPNQYPSNQYPSTQYPPTQYPSTQYPPTQYPSTQYPSTPYPNQYPNQYPNFNVPPPPYKAEPHQTSAEPDKSNPAPSAPDF